MQRSLRPLSQTCRHLTFSSLSLATVRCCCRNSTFYAYTPSRWASSESSATSEPASTGQAEENANSSPKNGSFSPSTPGRSPSPNQKSSNRPGELPPDWDESPDYNVHAFTDLPSANFGVNQHIVINQEFKEALRQILWQFRAPIRYAFAYGSGVFPQTTTSSVKASTIHPQSNAPVSKIQHGKHKMIDFIFGVSHTQHWHSLNLQQHRDHYSSLGSLGSSAVSYVQDNLGAGVYFNPYITVNGTLIKYGVVNLDKLCDDLSDWKTLYLAGRLQKPVKILRDDPRVRLANQLNLISAVRTALLLLPEQFSEHDLYKTIAGISYLGDPRMTLGAENLNKVSNIVDHQLTNFRRLYAPLIENLPNISFQDVRCNAKNFMEDAKTNATLCQDMDPVRRGNMVRRLPKTFREKLYFQYQRKYQIPQLEFNKMLEQSDDDGTRIRRTQGGEFEQRIAREDQASLNHEVSAVLQNIIKWPSYSQSLKGLFTSGLGRSWKYVLQKWEKNKEGRKKGKTNEKG